MDGKTFSISHCEPGPLTPHELLKLQSNAEDDHVTKSSPCKGCLVGDGPLKPHYRKDPDARMHYCLHADIAGRFAPTSDGLRYFLVGALRLPDRPLLFHVQLLKTRAAQEVTSALSDLIVMGVSICPSPFL
eukprot:5780832-Amphidinium_carterae.1